MPEPLPPDVRNALRDRFQAAFGERLDQLILYGSHARGEARPLSDVDLLVVLDGEVDRSDRERAYAVMHELFDEHELDLSPLVTSREWFDTYNQPLFRNVRAEGELLVPRDSPEAVAALRRHTYPPDIGPRGLKQPTEDSLDRAHQVLESARRGLEEVEDPNGTISAAYKAMYHAAQAALNEAGKAPKSHLDVQRLLRETYVQKGLLDAHHYSLLSEAEDKRLQADYEMTPSFTLEQAEEWITRAEDFVDAVESMLRDRNDP